MWISASHTLPSYISVIRDPYYLHRIGLRVRGAMPIVNPFNLQRQRLRNDEDRNSQTTSEDEDGLQGVQGEKN